MADNLKVSFFYYFYYFFVVWRICTISFVFRFHVFSMLRKLAFSACLFSARRQLRQFTSSVFWYCSRVQRCWLSALQIYFPSGGYYVSVGVFQMFLTSSLLWAQSVEVWPCFFNSHISSTRLTIQSEFSDSCKKTKSKPQLPLSWFTAILRKCELMWDGHPFVACVKSKQKKIRRGLGPDCLFSDVSATLPSSRFFSCRHIGYLSFQRYQFIP